MLEKELQTAREAASEAGQILARMSKGSNVVKKKGEIDLVTEADLLAEEAILRLIRRRFRDDAVLSEESSAREGTSGRTWVVDPLDGTVNFAHGFPFYAVSIALEIEGEPVLGVVKDPVRGERFEAVKGEGAFLGEKRITVSDCRKLNDGLLCTGFPYDIREDPKQVLSLFRAMILKARGVRRPGSAALDLCFVASGRADGFWEMKLNPWDTAAGALLVREAGGIVTNFRGEEYRSGDPGIIAGNPFIHPAILEAVSAEIRA
jgi:myo-inositol-1(or 4)-monophosphatase